ncbi:hypothetical protein UFOVP1313_36 [uncultured Caudovirales phage]|uniref:Uncharacterized protein n=1 Tax=uncultured Caudovirales phage TaxID=2100421 RepID=A0A6J5RLM0_9CAUD|nr:hypothetical protein UFOVP1313_36 [uncultured Caudovirales phage]
MKCWLSDFSAKPCDGVLVRVHLIPRQLIKREVRSRQQADMAITDSRSWVWACGGPMGNAGHHGMLDQSRTLKVPRNRLPAGVEELAAEIGVSWWLDREYGNG